MTTTKTRRATRATKRAPAKNQVAGKKAAPARNPATAKLRYYHGDKPMADSQNKLSSIVYYYAQDSKGYRMTTEQFVKFLASKGFKGDPRKDPFLVELPNGTQLSASVDGAGVPKGVRPSEPHERKPRGPSARTAREADEHERLIAVVDERKALKDWSENGSDENDKPATPVLDALKNDVVKEQEIGEAEKPLPLARKQVQPLPKGRRGAAMRKARA